MFILFLPSRISHDVPLLQIKSPTPVVVDFWATTCENCKAIAPFYETLSSSAPPHVKFYKLDIYDQHDASEEVSIYAVSFRCVRINPSLTRKDIDADFHGIQGWQQNPRTRRGIPSEIEGWYFFVSPIRVQLTLLSRIWSNPCQSSSSDHV